MTRINPISPTIRAQYKKEKDSDADYCIWLREQKSAFSGKYPCVPAHYRTSANSGIGIKPLFSAIPLTDAEHKEQHRIGTFKFASRKWWEAMVTHYQATYIQLYRGKIPPKYLIKETGI